MGAPINNLIKFFDEAIQHKEKGNFSTDDVENIYKASQEVFKETAYIEQKDLMKIRDKFVQLAEIEKSHAMRKLQGTSRAQAIHSVLLSKVQK